jgi:creatinine amidohydrolase
MTEVRWERMFPDQLEAAFAARPIVYFAYGLCEPHGAQNAVGLDSLKAHAIACAAATEYGGIVAPPDYWHIHEIGGYGAWATRTVGEVERAWLTAVPPWVHFKNVCYHIRAADVIGFHAAILITGHYGPNWRDLKTLVDLIQPYVGVRLYGLPDFEANEPGFLASGGNSGDHAGRVETSLLWALEPACVDLSRLPSQDEPSPHFAMGPDAADSNRRIGERMVADEVRWLGAKAEELLAAYDREQSASRLRTFDDIEEFWDQNVRPRLKDFQSMQPRFNDRDVVSSESRWFANWAVPERS